MHISNFNDFYNIITDYYTWLYKILLNSSLEQNIIVTVSGDIKKRKFDKLKKQSKNIFVLT